MDGLISIAWYDVVGTSGVVLILIAYFLLLGERLSSKALSYSVLNLVGAMLITVSLVFEFNLSAVIIEVFWMVASAYGVWRALRNRAQIEAP
jgi:drug/metabolite transporter (DMT)-like permease